MTATHLPGMGINVHLGRNKPRFFHPHLRLKNYIRPGAATPPTSWDATAKMTSIGMGGNDSCGDCDENMMANLISSWTANAAGAERTFPAATVVGWYSAITGYVPGNDRTDNGTSMQDGFAYWMGKGLAGDQLPGYVGIDPTQIQQHKIGVWEFGGSCLGIGLPAAWQNQSSPTGVWDVGPNMLGQWAPYSWGGHAVPLLSFDENGGYVATWAYKQRITWAAIQAYCDEAYACASWDWCLATGTPSGVARSSLITDFGAIGGGQLVPPGPAPGPAPASGGIGIDLANKVISYPTGWTARQSV